MRKLSSSTTFWNKRVFPFLWFGILAVVACGMVVPIGPTRPPIGLVLIPAVMAIFGYFMMRWLVFPLADEVFLDGNDLVVRKSHTQVRFPVRQIINVDSSTMTNPERITLTLREPCDLGREIVFSPIFRFHLFSRHPIVGDLIAMANGLDPNRSGDDDAKLR